MSSPKSDATQQAMRAKVASKLAETLVSASSSSDVDPELAREISVEIESEMWDALGKTPKEYTTKGRSLVFNLSKNAELRRRVLQRQITATKLVSATSKELAPEQIKLQRAASIDRYYATRVQGDSSERLVGWQAGTSGKLERSHKFDETEGGPSEGGPPKSEGPYLEPDDTLLDAPPAAAPASAVQSEFVRALGRAKLLQVGLTEATSGAGVPSLSGDASEDAVRVAEAMARVREIAEVLS